MQIKQKCSRCNGNLILMDGFYFCQKCGIDYRPSSMEKKYDDYWTRNDENEIMDELDYFFYSKYPQFKKDRV